MYYSPKSKEERFETAVNALQEFVVNYESSNKFKVVDRETTNDFKKFKDEVTKNGFMRITSLGCDNTIYSKGYYNIIARVWHDDLHLKNDLDFSLEDEKKVCYLQIEEISKYLLKEGFNQCTVEDVKEVLYFDIIGQAKEYEKIQKFVENQKEFVFNRFLNEGGV